jgi:hypothetical protein
MQLVTKMLVKTWLVRSIGFVSGLAVLSSLISCAPRSAEFKNQANAPTAKAKTSSASSSAIIDPLGLKEVNHQNEPFEIQFKVNAPLVANYEIAFCGSSKDDSCFSQFMIQCDASNKCKWINLWPTNTWFESATVTVTPSGEIKTVKATMTDIRSHDFNWVVKVRAVIGEKADQIGKWYESAVTI